MATGWPMKTTYANGDVYSSQDVNDITGTINLLTSSTLSVASGKNVFINGGMDIWQRGTSFTGTTTAFCADRWQAYRGATGSTFSRQVTNDTTNLPFIQYATRVSRDSGNTSVVDLYFFQNVETVNAIPVAGRAVTLSFYARKGANYSAASSLLGVKIITGTGTDQNIGGGYTGQADTLSSSATLTTTWQRFSYTATIPATAKEFCPFFTFTPVGTAGAADYYEITGVQLELGSTATTFSRAGGTIQGELAACQRYYYRVVAGGANGSFGVGQAVAGTGGYVTIPYPVTMRTAPSTLEQTGTASNYAVFNASSSLIACSAVPSLLSGYSGASNGFVNFSVASGLTAGNATVFYANSSTTAYLGFSAEL